jgi:hypothetical protein
MLQVFYEQARQEGTGEGGPLGRSGPVCVRESKWAQQQAQSTKLLSKDVTAGAEHEATSIGGQQVRSTRRSRAPSCIHGQAAGMEHETKQSTKLHS